MVTIDLISYFTTHSVPVWIFGNLTKEERSII